MKILIDIGHPAHVHYFRNFYKIMARHGHEIMVTARDKEMTHELLQSYEIPFSSRGKGAAGAAGKLAYLLKGDAILLRKALSFKPDIFLSFSSPYAAQVSALLRKPHIALDDTEHAKLARLFYRPFSDVILSPESYRGSSGRKQIKFNSFLELCYLHPDYFTPDEKVLETLGVEKDEKFVLMRFVSWQANHDIGHQGLTLENKRMAIEAFSKYATVFISSEEPLPDDLQQYRLPAPAKKIHD
ncbi:MAG TPA: DUF354 domain-containing protein, partial [Balneolaceae bacterium]|nr:DUF354 domain-containing protein [Balneolaceae bacterium]